MSGLLATTHDAGPRRIYSALVCISTLGGDRDETWSDPRCTLSVTRKAWQLHNDFSGDCLLLHRDGLVVAADASIYDRAYLRRALRSAGKAPHGSTPSHLIAAAYRAWGERLIERLDGDYAFVIWDTVRQRLFAARDPMGARPIFFAELPQGAVAVASSSRAVAHLRGTPDDLNLATLGTQVAGLAWALGRESSYEGVEALPPGHVLIADGQRVRVERAWRPPPAPAKESLPEREAAEVLRELLSSAVIDRMGSETASVWMSGGWDSTAVFAAGQAGLDEGRRARLRPVSISYPPDDPGCEDELIRSVARFWTADVAWVRSADIPLLDHLEERAARSDEPPAHLYELWNCALARRSRAAGTRIVLDGGGGDQLFRVSDVMFADLLRRGEWREAARMSRSRGLRWRSWLRLGLLPMLPTSLADLAGRTLGTPRHYLEREVMPWMRRDFVEAHALRERDLVVLRDFRAASIAQTESVMFVTAPIWSWGASYMRGPLLAEGVETRSPLLDRRITEFALSRPVHERANAAETKVLLRRSMKGLLPPEVLAPRSHRTGTTVGFSRRRMREVLPTLVTRLFEHPLRLAELGMIEPAILERAARRAIAGDIDDTTRVNVFHAMKVEFWLRGLARRGAESNGVSHPPTLASTSRPVAASCAGQPPVGGEV
jgi:asparagine synthase (glutamine-hydrolysing)